MSFFPIMLKHCSLAAPAVMLPFWLQCFELLATSKFLCHLHQEGEEAKYLPRINNSSRLIDTSTLIPNRSDSRVYSRPISPIRRFHSCLSWLSEQLCSCIFHWIYFHPPQDILILQLSQLRTLSPTSLGALSCCFNFRLFYTFSNQKIRKQKGA